MEQYNKAYTYFESALKLNHLVKNDVMYARIYNQLAMLEKNEGNFEAAIEMYRKTYAYSNKIHWKKGMAAALSNIGNVYMLLEDYDIALNYHLESLEIEEQLNHHYGIMWSKNTLGELYYLIKDYTKSEAYLKESLSMAEAENNHDLLSKTYQHLVSLYRAQGKNQLALQAYDNMLIYKDSLYNTESVQKISDIETKYQSEKKEHQIELLAFQNQLAKSENDRQKGFIKMLALVLSLIVASSVMFFVMYLNKQKAFKSLVKQNVEAAKADIQLAECSSLKTEEKPTLTNDKKGELIRDIERLIIKDKIFEHTDISLESFSKALNSNRQYVSQLINENYKKNFTQFINEFRIRQARIYLTNDVYDKYTLEGIAKLVGFNSRSAFIASFKKFTGVTPSFYKKNKNT
jgi:AraC-like DNA-binding protein